MTVATPRNTLATAATVGPIPKTIVYLLFTFTDQNTSLDAQMKVHIQAVSTLYWSYGRRIHSNTAQTLLKSQPQMSQRKTVELLNPAHHRVVVAARQLYE